jgi:hypothetical protein
MKVDGFAASGNISGLFGQLKLLKITCGGGGDGARYWMAFLVFFGSE